MMPFTNKSVVSTTLIGRAPHLATLDNLLTQVGQGSGQVVLVGGEAGIGKSRFVREVRHRARQQGWQTAQGRCFEPDRIFPYAPLIDLLRSDLARHPARDATSLFGPLLSEVVKLLPELALTLPDLTPTPRLDPEAEKRRLFETLVQFLVGLIQAEPQHDLRPLILIVEDLHWSDDTSLEFLRQLARRLARQPLLMLLTYRSDELNPNLQHFLAELSREQRPVELTLPRLRPAEVDALLRAIFEQERPMRAEFLEAIFNLTAGNPFFIEEVLKVLIAAGDIFYSDGAWDRKPINELRIPHSVQDAVQRRVAQLSEEARHTLTVAAVIGQQVDFGVLQAVTEWPEAELLAQFKELLTTQLVVDLSAERFAFRHALTRQAVYSELLARERQALHRQIGETLERREVDASTAVIASLAYHFYEAGTWEKALTYARLAGEQAQALYTPRAALEQFTRALQAAQHLERTDLQPDLYRERGLAYEIVGDFEPSRADLKTALKLARAAENRQLEWRVLLDLGKLWSSRDYDRTGTYFQEALHLASTLDDPMVLARSLNRMGNWHLNSEAPRQALDYHEEALTIFQALNDQPGLAQTFDLLGMTNLLGGDPVQGAACCLQAIDLFNALDDRQRLASCLTTLILCGPSLTTDTVISADLSPAESVNWGEQAMQHAREIGWRAGEAYTSTLAGQSLDARGRVGQALALMQHGFEIAQEIEHRQWMCVIHRELGTLYLDMLALAPAHQHFEQSLALAKEIGSSFHLLRATGYLVSCLILERQFSQAEALLNTMGDLELPMQTLAQRLIWRGRVELALAQGDSTLALQIVDQLFSSATNTQNRNPGAIPYLAKLRGQALTALQRWPEAEETLMAALATAQAQDTPRLVWRIHVALGQLYQAQETYAKAKHAFAAARTVIDDLAATVPDIALRDNFVRRARAMISSPKPSTPLQAAKQAHGGLTRREREVAALVAEGKSNREIAETLVLGIRTVEGHVSNILGKLGFTSRTEIALWAMEIGLRTNSE